MKLGIVGLPNVGKSTLFNAITNAGIPADNYAFCTIDPNVGVVSVPDARLQWLRALHNPKKFTPAVIEFVDIAGLVKGASKGEGLGNKFLSNIRTTDAIVHVVRCFDDGNVTHVEGGTDPLRDIEIINMELIFSDVEMCERRLDKAQKAAKGGDKRFVREIEVFQALLAHLNEGRLARTFDCAPDERAMIATSDLLTLKQTIYAANLSEDSVNEPDAVPYFQAVKQLADEEGSLVLPICAKLEADIAELDDEEEKAMFMEELGLHQSGLDRLIRCSYDLLGLISFLTAGSDECRAWTIKKGTKAPQAAGKIHTDFERGFIRAEVIAFEDLKTCGTMSAAKAKGLVRSEGKEYIMRDGDIVNFLFNV
ncbi:MAG: redox-regulated ATPase YchF [Oscillospiraceae bacterium]|nr:redox-regulated ATPase YchF [Oscillospiraceae bacterium]